MEKQYLNKWVVIDPLNHSIQYLDRLEVMYCIKETAKQLQCVQNPDNITNISTRTISKKSVLKVVSAEIAAEIRTHAKNISNEYKEKHRELFAVYSAKMLNFEGDENES